MRKEAPKIISWIIVAVVVLSALWVMDLPRNHCQTHHHGHCNRVSPVITSGGSQKVKNVDWLFVLFWF